MNNYNEILNMTIEELAWFICGLQNNKDAHDDVLEWLLDESEITKVRKCLGKE